MTGYATPQYDGYSWMRSPVPSNWNERLVNPNTAAATDVLAGVSEMIVGECDIRIVFS